MALTNEVAALIQQTRAGDVQAFRKLYECYARKVLNFSYRLLGSRDLAEEVTQETFISVFKSLPALNDVSRFEPWLFMIARNYVYQAYRRKKPAARSIDETDEDDRELIRLESAEGTPEEQALKRELRGKAMEIIQSLDMKYKEVFVLAVLEGHSYEEVAEMVGRKIQSVKTDIHRARMKIREQLAPYLKEGSVEHEM